MIFLVTVLPGQQGSIIILFHRRQAEYRASARKGLRLPEKWDDIKKEGVDR